MTRSQEALKNVADGLISMFENFIVALSGREKISQVERSAKGRDLYRRALNPKDKGVTFWYDKKTGVLRTRLRVVSDTEVNKQTGEPMVRWAEMGEDGKHSCSCPDHKNNGAFCKHLRCLSGLTVKKTGQV